MNATDAFVGEVANAGARLDRLALLIAAHAIPDLDVGEWLGRLDDLAAGCRRGSAPALLEHLYDRHGFHGNHTDYYEPYNSFLNEVIRRRTGIPITLAVLVMEVGRRLDVEMVGVGMPGHFLLRLAAVGDGDRPFVDPFSGSRLGLDGCAALFAASGAGGEFSPSYLEPVGIPTIAGRMLANLKAIYRGRQDRTSLEWVLRLRAAVPGVGVDERRELASVLAAGGRFAEAAAELERAAVESGDEDAAYRFEAAAQRMRARLN